MAPSESQDDHPASIGDRAVQRPAGRLLVFTLPLAAAFLGAIFFWGGRVESVEVITYPQFLEKLKSGEIDRKAGIVVISKPGAMESVEAHLLHPPTRKVRAAVALEYERHLKIDLETQYGVVVTQKVESNLPWMRFFSK